jgi:guanidinopropionase
MFTREKLAALRAKYEGARAADVQDPEFRKVSEILFSGDDRRKQPYSGVKTFLDVPYRQDAAGEGGLDGLDVALVGVPMDLGVTNRSGARFGPRAVRGIERIGPYSQALRVAPTAALRVADIGDVPFRSRYSLEQSIEDIEAFTAKIVAAGVIPLSVGGDHSVTFPILKALARERPVGLVHIDAHCDTGGPFEGAKFHHGGPFREAVLAGALDPERTVQIGIRGSSEFLWEFSYDSGMTVIHADEVTELGVRAVIEKARAVVGDGPVYLSFDVDGLDPAFAPGTGTPEAGGLSAREVLAILRGMAGADIVGGDVVEVAPQYDATTNTAQIAAQALFEMLSLVALRRR